MSHRRDFKPLDAAVEAQEQQWLALVGQGGDAGGDALGRLYRAYTPLFVRRLMSFGLAPQDAQDLTQDLWLEIRRAARRYDASAPARLFLRGCLYLARMRYFAERRVQPVMQDCTDELVEASMQQAMLALAPASALPGFADFLRCVRQAFVQFEQAHPRLAQLLLLRHVEEMSLSEMAEQMGGSAAQAKDEVFRARGRFRPHAAPCQALLQS